MIHKLSYLNSLCECEIQFLRTRNPRANHRDSSRSGHLMRLWLSVGVAIVIWRLNWSWKICFQDDVLTWLLAGGLSSLPCGALCRAAGVASGHGCQLPPEQGEASVSLGPDIITHYHFCHILLSRTELLTATQLKGKGIKLCLFLKNFSLLVFSIWWGIILILPLIL